MHHAGPVWLDQVNSSSLAPYGFGSEVGRAVEQRHEGLRALGIAPDDPRRAAKLRDLQQRAVGEAIAARTGQQYLAQVPSGVAATSTNRVPSLTAR